MRMVFDTRNVSLAGKSPAEAMDAIRQAEAELPEGSTDVVLQIVNGHGHMFHVCRLMFKRPQTVEEIECDMRYAA